VDLLYLVRVENLTDEQMASVEIHTKSVSNIVENHMMLDCTSLQCVPLSDAQHKLREAIYAIERGLPIDPAQRPSEDELMDQLNRRLAGV
jgi:hypothetical protein